MVAMSGRGWQLAPSLQAMVAEADRIAPKRSRASDGSIGDVSHQARESDHNPSGGWVDALDLTHDPRGGFDAHAMAQRVIARRDRRIKYIISNRRIYGPGSRFGWAGGPYTGASPHTAHAHFSVVPGGRFGVSPWFAQTPAPTVPPASTVRPPAYTPPPAPTPDPVPVPLEDDMPYLLEQKKNAPEVDAYWLIDGPVAVPVARESWLYIVANSEPITRITLDVPTARRLISAKQVVTT